MKVRMKWNIIRDIVELASPLIDEVLMRFDEENLIIQIVDPAHVAMTEITVKRDNFQTYEINPIAHEDNRHKVKKVLMEDRVGIDLDKLRDMLRTATYNEVLPAWFEIRTVPTKGPHDFDTEFEFPMPGPSNINTMVVRTKVDTTCMEIPTVPLLTLPVEVKFLPENLVRMLRYLEIVSDHVEICADTDGLAHITSMGDTVEGRSIFGSMMTKGTVAYKSLFPVDYLTNMMRACDHLPYMNMRIGDDLPLVWHGTTPDGVEARMLLAPRIESR
jgi:hypothetical protein